jgi:predicted DNA-binding transcriptional regulator YafY
VESPDWDQPEELDDRRARKRDRLARLLKVASILYSKGSGDEGVPVTEIARLTGMTTRTVYRDIKALDDELGMPIFAADRGRYGIEHKYFLPPLRLSVPEAIVLFLAARLIRRWSDEYDAAVISAFTKLADLLPQPVARHVAATMLAIGEASANEPYMRNFANVTRAWAEGRVVEMEYESPSGERKRTRARPYFLEPDAAGRSVYLIAHDETANALRTYKVERIRSSILTLDRYEIPADFDPDRWLAHSWGIWSSDTTPTATVRLRFDKSVAHRVRESVWHRSQRLTELPDGGVELEVTVAGIVEIRPWILSWGEGVEVLEPPELRTSVADAVRGASARYAD